MFRKLLGRSLAGFDALSAAKKSAVVEESAGSRIDRCAVKVPSPRPRQQEKEKEKEKQESSFRAARVGMMCCFSLCSHECWHA